MPDAIKKMENPRLDQAKKQVVRIAEVLREHTSMDEENSRQLAAEIVAECMKIELQHQLLEDA